MTPVNDAWLETITKASNSTTAMAVAMIGGILLLSKLLTVWRGEASMRAQGMAVDGVVKILRDELARLAAHNEHLTRITNELRHEVIALKQKNVEMEAVVNECLQTRPHTARHRTRRDD